MSEIFYQHVPVLLRESVTTLITTIAGTYVDATFGRGSHSKAILERLNSHGKLIAFDKDKEAVAYAQQHFGHDPRFQIFHQSFTSLECVLKAEHQFGKINGILFDLGVSSPQLDNPSRGFSFLRLGNLDMRMDTSQGLDAMTWLATVAEKKLADVLWQYGEEKCSRRIARAIVETRKTSPIITTTQLASIIAKVMPRQKAQDKHPATRSFQAIRIFINDELSELSAGLDQALNVLEVNGRLAVISFHSLEDRIVKQFIKLHEKGAALPRRLPIKGDQFSARLKSIGKPIKASKEEIDMNPRARSAILRIAEKL